MNSDQNHDTNVSQHEPWVATPRKHDTANAVDSGWTQLELGSRYVYRPDKPQFQASIQSFRLHELAINPSNQKKTTAIEARPIIR